MTTALLSLAGLVILAAVAAALVLLLGHATWLMAYGRYREPRLDRTRSSLHRLLFTEGRIPDEALADVRALPAAAQDRLILDLTRSFGGAVRDRVVQIAQETGVARRARRRLGSWLWWRRLRGARILTFTGGREIEMLPLLFDRHPAVRDQAIEWAGDHPSPRVARSLVALLTSPFPVSRYAIHDALLRIGAEAVGPIASELRVATGPRLLAVIRVAIGKPQPAYAATAVTLCSNGEPEIRGHAAELLGAVGGEDAVQVLQEMLDDPAPDVRASAAAALGRIGHWPAAAAISRLLTDRHWDVRRNAAFALRDLGSPGTLLLRRATSHDDPFAADMAIYVLGLDHAPRGRL